MMGDGRWTGAVEIGSRSAEAQIFGELPVIDQNGSGRNAAGETCLDRLS